jgi:hypothetical protein
MLMVQKENTTHTQRLHMNKNLGMSMKQIGMSSSTAAQSENAPITFPLGTDTESSNVYSIFPWRKSITLFLYLLRKSGCIKQSLASLKKKC